MYIIEFGTERMIVDTNVHETAWTVAKAVFGWRNNGQLRVRETIDHDQLVSAWLVMRERIAEFEQERAAA